MVDWGRIGEIIVEFFKNHSLPVVASTGVGVMAFGPEGAALGVGGAIVSTLVRQPWLRSLLSTLVSVVPPLIRWVRSSRNQPNSNEPVAENMTFQEFVRTLVTMVTEVLRRLHLTPNHSPVSYNAVQRYHYPSPGA